MIQEKNKKRFEELILEIKNLFPDSTTSIKIFISADETTLTTNHKYADELKKKNISMRNIKGDWIE